MRWSEVRPGDMLLHYQNKLAFMVVSCVVGHDGWLNVTVLSLWSKIGSRCIRTWQFYRHEELEIWDCVRAGE